MALLFEGLHEEQIGDTDSRIVFNIKPDLAPIKINIFPLMKNKHAEKARELYAMLAKYCMVQYEESGSYDACYYVFLNISFSQATSSLNRQNTAFIVGKSVLENRIMESVL